MTNTDAAALPEVARCRALIDEWARLPESRKKDETRRQIEQTVQTGVYNGSDDDGPSRQYRVKGVVLDGGAFYVEYSHYPEGKKQRMMLLRFLPNVLPLGSPQARFRLLFSDVA